MATLPQVVGREVDAAGLSGRVALAAVSGGPDSLALLHALHRLNASHGLRLHVAHVDHGLRSTSHQDAEFVRSRAEELGLPCTVAQVDVPQSAAGSFPEGAARTARYRALARVAHREGANAIALGHTLDDQAETVLLHAVRGAGLPGLRAMTPLSPLPVQGGGDARLFRPLLGVRRSETAAYCRSLGLTPLQDETNNDARIPRNLLRLEIVPLLERLNPRSVAALGRLAMAAGGSLDFMNASLDAVWPELAVEADGLVTLDRRRLLAAHPALQRHAIVRAYRCATGAEGALDMAHVEAALRLAPGPAGKETPLPGGVWVEARHDSLVFHSQGKVSGLPPLQGEHAILLPGVTIAGGWKIEVEPVSRPDDLHGESNTAYLDGEALGGPLCLRAWRPGDRFQPLGMVEGSKKLQDFFVDAHVPRRSRDAVPLVVSPSGVAWVVGHRTAHWARVTPESARTLRVVVVPVEDRG